MNFNVKGVNVLIDKEDLKLVENRNWHFMKGYARTRDGNGHIYMHQLIFGKKPGFVIDHINRNILDNRKSNLRYCTRKQNQQNRNKLRNKTSKYIGVCVASGKAKRKKPWRALIKNKLIGYFQTEKEAAKAYDVEAKKIYGEFAPLNFVDSDNGFY